jgi:hypothetical protein
MPIPPVSKRLQSRNRLFQPSRIKNEKERPAPEGLLNVVLSLQTDGRTELAQAVELVAIIENELGI